MATTPANPASPDDPLGRLADALRDLPPESAPGTARTSASADASPTSDLAHLVPPQLQRLQRYVVLRLLGRGGMGAVYLAHPRDLPDREVALKVLPPIFADDPVLLERFRRSATTASRIDHPGVVRVHEVGEDQGVFFQIQDLVPEGRTLHDWLREAREARALPKHWYRDVAATLEQVARALAAVHAAKVIHRDIKPSNILLLPDGTPKVADFGLAKDLDGASGLTQDGSPGTLNYKSPEQVSRRFGVVGERSDVYAFGATMYEALTLTRLHPGDEPADVLPRILGHDVEDLRQVRPGVPRELSVLCRKCLEREPARRYPTMAAVAEELARYLRHEPIAATEPGVVERARKWGKRNPTASAVLATACLAAAGLGWLATANAALARDKVELAARESQAKEDALTNARLAEERGRVAAQRADEVLSLSTFQDLAELASEAEQLWPVRPEATARYEAWLGRFRQLVEGSPAAAATEGRRPSLAEQRRRLDALRQSARTPDDEALATAQAEHRLAPQLALVRQSIANCDAALALPDVPAWLAPRLREQREQLARQADAIGAEIDAATRWLYDSAADRWWHAQLGQLVRQLDRLLDPYQGLAGGGIGDGIGWGMQRRLDHARTVLARCCTSDVAVAAWRAVADGLAGDPRFAGFELPPQLDLLPLGRDPQSGLFEFAHLPSGEPPVRGADGGLVYAPDAAIVLVLVPGGTFDMGAQADDPALPNFDPAANPKTEGPVHAVALAPYFLGKHEVTQSQWQRLTGGTPSQYPAGGVIPGRMVTLRDPVERVDWTECMTWLPRFGLTLPTEAQWERAVRAGGTEPWSTGRDVRSIEGAANVADQRLLQQGGPKDWSYDTWLDDGFVVHAAVGSLRPNAYGLHDMHGNVAEWCLDGDADYRKSVRAGDGLRQATMEQVVYRGGGFMDPAVRSRSAGRQANQSGTKTHSLGVRAARLVEPRR